MAGSGYADCCCRLGGRLCLRAHTRAGSRGDCREDGSGRARRESVPNTDTHCHGHLDAYRHAYGHPKANADAYRHPKTNAGAYRHAKTHADAYRYAKTHADAYRYAKTYADAYRYAKAYADPSRQLGVNRRLGTTERGEGAGGIGHRVWRHRGRRFVR